MNSNSWSPSSSRVVFTCSTVVVLVFVNLLNYMDRYTIAGGLVTSLDRSS